MRFTSILLTVCIGFTAAASVKRQDQAIATPPRPSLPPVQSTQAAGIPDVSQDKTPPPPSTTSMVTDSVTSSAAIDTTTGAPDDTVDNNNNNSGSTTGAPPSSTTPMAEPSTTPSAPPQPESTTSATEKVTTASSTVIITTPAPVTTAKPQATTIVSVDEIVTVFEEMTDSEYFKRLPYDDQILVLELVSGAETGKMTPILDQIGYERLLGFIYDLPLKYQDSTFGLIETGFKREKLLMKG